MSLPAPSDTRRVVVCPVCRQPVEARWGLTPTHWVVGLLPTVVDVSTEIRPCPGGLTPVQR
jgi:hypothetical protein